MFYKKQISLVTALCFVLSCVAPGFAHAGEFKVLGPKTYVRGDGRVQTDTFNVLNKNTQFKMYLVNGPGSYSRVLGAIAKLNGSNMSGIAFLTVFMASFQIPIFLKTGSNTLSLALLGLPNSALSIEIRGVDNAVPTIQITSPQSGQSFTSASVLAEIQMSDAISGIDPQSFQVLLNGVDRTVDFTQPAAGLSSSSTGTVTLADGTNTLLAKIRDLAGNEAQSSVTVTLNAVVNQAPVVSAGQDQTITLPATASLSGAASDDSLPTGSSLTTTWSKFSGPGTVTFGDVNSLSTTATFSQPGSYMLRLSASDTELASFDDAQITVNEVPPVLPPDPATVAPPLNNTAVTNTFSATEFIYSGPNPIQTGVVPGTIDFVQSALLRGKVTDKNGDPLPMVEITIVDRPEFGSTLTRADGMFDMVINGGGPLTVQYSRSGYLTVHRQVDAAWNDYAWLPDVMMTQLDTQVTPVTQTAQIQVAQGNVISDLDGVRQATLLFPPNTAATLVMPDESTVQLTSFNVRATEYTVGADGKAAMPAPLPASSGYTYAVEYSLDEAQQAGATTVQFNQPVISYTENFIGFPVGGIVPVGYYDKECSCWVPSENGRVIKILDITAGVADLDVDGSNLAASPAQLDDLGITTDELQTLAQRYAVGQSLWRVLIPHFSSWDFNWPVGPPVNAVIPNTAEALGPGNFVRLAQPQLACGSEIQCENQILGEAVDIAGAPISLKYQSDRVPGFNAKDSLTIPLTPASIPSSLKRVDLKITIGGKIYDQTFAPAPNLAYDFVWDRIDAFGRTMQGQQNALIRIGYAYDLLYQEPADRPQSFGLISGALLAGGVTRVGSEIILSQERRESLGVWDAREQNLAGWTVNQHHVYEPLGKVLHTGDGRQRNTENANYTIKRIDVPAGQIQGMDVGADGVLYYADGNRIAKVNADGVVTTVFGAVGASDVNVASDGSLFIAEPNIGRVSQVKFDQNPAGIRQTVAGEGAGGDGGPANQALLDTPTRIDLDNDGNLYILEDHGSITNRVRKVTPSGIIETVVGGTTVGFGGDGGPAINALTRAADFAIGPDGSIYIADTGNNRIRKISNDGIIATIAGTGIAGTGGDGGPGTQAEIDGPTSVTVAMDGVIYVYSPNRIMRIGTDGILTTEPHISGGNFTEIVATYGRSSTAGPDGSIFFSVQDNLFNFSIYRVSPPLPGLSRQEILVPSEDATELYIFDRTGRHLRTINALTQGILYSFDYDSAGRLVKVTDGDANETIINRDISGNPTSILSPYGQSTDLEVDANGYLDKITDPAGNVHEYTYDPQGLMQTFKNPNLKNYQFTFDADGLLSQDQDPAGGFQDLTRTTLTNGGFEVSRKTALNRETKYKFENLPFGYRRTLTASDGTVRSEEHDTNSAFVSNRTLNDPNGATTQVIDEVDPLWGIQSKYPSSIHVTALGGINSSTTVARTVFPPNFENDPFSISSKKETVTVNGKQYQSTYNTASKTYANITPLNRQSLETIDTLGRVTQQAVTGLEPVNFTYDLRGRLNDIKQGAGLEEKSTVFAYNPAGFLQSVTDAENRAVSFEYDLAGRVTKQTLPGNRDILYGYDGNGNVTSITPPGRPAHVFQYTDVDLQSEYNPPDTGLPLDKTVYSFNLDKDLTLITRPDGQAVAFNYEPSGRLDSLTTPSGIVDYSYNAAGQISSVAFPGGAACAYVYTAFLLKKETWSGSVAGFIDYTYDPDFRLTSFDVNGVNPISFGYDNDSLLTQAGSLTLARNAQNGLLSGTTLGNVTDIFAYNGFAEVQGYTANYSGSPVYQTTFLRDKLGRITQKTETLSSITAVYDYTYDLEGRLQEVKKDNVITQTYTYDSNGNRSPGVYDAQDRLTSYGANAYAYNANGDLQTKTTGSDVTTYTYDVLGNLMDVTLPDTTQISYVIDGQNRRVGKRINGSLAQGFLYRNSLSPIAELDGANNVISTFVYGSKANIPDYMTKAGNTYRIVSDHLGSPRLVIDAATGTVAQQMDFDEFGNVTNDTNPGFQPFGFAGGLYDNQTKLTRFGARDYDAEVGRWTSKDPILFDGGDTNLYGYTLIEPVIFLVPLGSEWLDDSANFSAGFGDAFSFGITRGIRQQMGIDSVVNNSSGWYQAGEWASVAASVTLGAAAGARAAGGKGAGMEFSHWIPNRWGGSSSIWNGNFVTTAQHALSDPYRYRFMSAAWKSQNPLPNAFLRQISRLPKTLVGTAAGTAYGIAGKAKNDNC